MGAKVFILFAVLPKFANNYHIWPPSLAKLWISKLDEVVSSARIMCASRQILDEIGEELANRVVKPAPFFFWCVLSETKGLVHKTTNRVAFAILK